MFYTRKAAFDIFNLSWMLRRKLFVSFLVNLNYLLEDFRLSNSLIFWKWWMNFFRIFLSEFLKILYKLFIRKKKTQHLDCLNLVKTRVVFTFSRSKKKKHFRDINTKAAENFYRELSKNKHLNLHITDSAYCENKRFKRETHWHLSTTQKQHALISHPH